MGERPEADQFLLAEYSALREEIVKRIELEYQIIYLTLFIFSTMCGFALSYKIPLIVLPYPILCVLLTSAWINSDSSIFHISEYIKNQIEATVGQDTIGWEHYIAPRKFPLLSLSSVGDTFVITTLIAIGIGISLVKIDATGLFLLILDIIGLVYMNVSLSWYHLKRTNKGIPSYKLSIKAFIQHYFVRKRAQKEGKEQS